MIKKLNILCIAIALSIFNYCLSMEPNESYTNQNQRALNSSDGILPFVIVSTPQYAPSSSQTKYHDDDQKFVQYPNPLNEELVEKIYSTVPKNLKIMIHCLQNPLENFEDQPKSLVLHGPPGGGKTTLGQVIAQKAGWQCALIRAACLPTKYQNSAGENFKKAIASVLKNQDEKWAVIVDEFTHLTDHNKDEKDSNRGSARAIWSVLDDCATHPNIFIIATTNDIKDFPPSLKDRFGTFHIIEIPLPNLQARKNLITYHLNTTDCDEKFIDYLAQRSKGKSYREIKELIAQAKRIAHYENREVTKDDFTDLLKNWKSWWHISELYKTIKEYLPTTREVLPLSLQIAGLIMNVKQFNQQKLSFDFQKSSTHYQQLLQRVGITMQETALDLQKKALTMQEDSIAITMFNATDLDQYLTKYRKNSLTAHQKIEEAEKAEELKNKDPKQ